MFPLYFNYNLQETLVKQKETGQGINLALRLSKKSAKAGFFWYNKTRGDSHVEERKSRTKYFRNG